MSDGTKRIIERMEGLKDPGQAAHAQRFFRTGKGEYGEGDRFLGLRVPQVRALVREVRDLELPACLELLRSPWHEVRLLAVLLLVERYARAADDAGRTAVYRAYLDHAHRVNNWDLVDVSAHKIVGPHLERRSRRPLYRLARSDLLWERRIAVIATYHFIRRDDFADCLALCEALLGDGHDLIHKATGWMLREVGKRDRAALVDFLDRHGRAMPRTMLRYAIEKLPEARRRAYLRTTR